MRQYICVYDFETDGPDPHTCEPIQLAACIIHNITLEIVPDSEFMIHMKPSKLSDESYYAEHKSTIEWHAKNKNTTPQEVFEKWQTYPERKFGWEHFVQYLLKYNKDQSKKSQWTAPIRAGANVRNFDNIIIDRLASQYGNISKDGKQNIFWPRDTIDIIEMSFYWFENLPEPGAYNMDTLREFFGIPATNTHDALQDVKDEAWIIQRFLKLFRKEAPKVTFKGAWYG